MNYKLHVIHFTSLWGLLHSCLKKHQFYSSNLFLIAFISLVTWHSFLFPCALCVPLHSSLVMCFFFHYFTSSFWYSGHWGTQHCRLRGCIKTFLLNLVICHCTFNIVSCTNSQLSPAIFLEDSTSHLLSWWSLISWDLLFLFCCSHVSFFLEYWTLSLHSNYLSVCHLPINWNWTKGIVKLQHLPPPKIKSCTQHVAGTFPTELFVQDMPMYYQILCLGPSGIYSRQNSFVPLSFFKWSLVTF